MGPTQVVIGLRVRCFQALAPDDVIGGIDGAVLVKIAEWQISATIFGRAINSARAEHEQHGA
jgi:hypothetical protein